MDAVDWVAWHAPYDDPGSSLNRRLAVVRRRIRDALDTAPPGPIRAVSVCAGQGRDLLGVLADHPRRDDVHARLVELDERNVAHAREAVHRRALVHVDVVEGDASTTSAYEGAVPAHLVLVCGVFGNVVDGDVGRTVDHLPMLCDRDAVVIWTRHRRAPDATPAIRAAFARRGFDEVAFDTHERFSFAVGTNRYTGRPAPFVPGVRLFDFVGKGRGGHP